MGLMFWYKGGTSASLSTGLKYFRDDPTDHLLEPNLAQRQQPFVPPLPETDFLKQDFLYTVYSDFKG